MYGGDDGKDIFDRLQGVVDQYNMENDSHGGKAFLQWYEAPVSEMDDKH